MNLSANEVADTGEARRASGVGVMAHDIDQWIDNLLAELKRVSTRNWAREKTTFVATPKKITHTIRKQAHDEMSVVGAPHFRVAPPGAAEKGEHRTKSAVS